MTNPKNFYASTLTIAIIAGLFFALSGACTGLFAWDAEFGQGGGYQPNHWYEALAIGAFGLIPFGLMLWAGVRGVRRGANKTSAIIFLIAGLPFFAYGCLGFFSLLGEFRHARAPSFVLLLVMLALLAFGAFLGYTSIRMFMHKPKSLTEQSFE